MKILYLVDFFYPNKWWIEVLLSQITDYFSKKNDVFVITRRYDKSLAKEEKIWNTMVYRIDAKNLYHFYFKAYEEAKKIIQEVDVIHSNTFFSAFIWNKLSKKYKKRHLVHIHWFFWKLRNYVLDWKFKFLKSWKFQYFEKKIANFDAEFICVSKYVYDVMKFVYWVEDDKLHLVYNWLDKKKWLSYVDEEKIKNIKKQIKANNEFVFLFYGRNEKVKNLNMLIDAFKEVNIPNSKLILLASDFWNDGYHKEIWKNIFLYPAVEHCKLPNWIKAADVIVFPSITESFGYVGLETSLLWKPLIASEGGAIPEIVWWKVIFFNPFKQDELKKALIKAYNNKFDLIPEKKFDILTTIKHLEKVY